MQGLYRRALVDIEVGDVRIPAESTLVLKWGAANRDPGKFADPDRFDLDRGNVTSTSLSELGRIFAWAISWRVASCALRSSVYWPACGESGSRIEKVARSVNHIMSPTAFGSSGSISKADMDEGRSACMTRIFHSIGALSCFIHDA